MGDAWMILSWGFARGALRVRGAAKRVKRMNFMVACVIEGILRTRELKKRNIGRSFLILFIKVL
jgi:hypothetical protein